MVSFATTGEAVQGLLDFEQSGRADGSWTGPGFLDLAHPLNAFIRKGLS